MPPSFAIGADQVGAQRNNGANQGLGIGSQFYDDEPRFDRNIVVNVLQIGKPLPAGIDARVSRPAGAQVFNKQMMYVKVQNTALPPDGEATQGSQPLGFFNRTGMSIPKNKYFWAIKG